MYHIAFRFQDDDSESNHWQVAGFHPEFPNVETALEYITTIASPECAFEYIPLYILPTLGKG